ncbi:MAG TPA: hypothetical protein VHN11_23150 [Xanthobacteraceae bacterium]|nr:hypothetical protein [Xanthobacteraceae bacterium]
MLKCTVTATGFTAAVTAGLLIVATADTAFARVDNRMGGINRPNALSTGFAGSAPTPTQAARVISNNGPTTSKEGGGSKPAPTQSNLPSQPTQASTQDPQIGKNTVVVPKKYGDPCKAPQASMRPVSCQAGTRQVFFQDRAAGYVAAKIKTGAKFVGHEVKEGAVAVGHEVKQGAVVVGHTASNVGSAVGSAAQTVGHEVSSAAGSVAHAATRFYKGNVEDFRQWGSSIKYGANKAVDAIGSAAKSVGSGANSAAHYVGSAASAAFHATASAVSGAVHTVGDAAGSAAHTVRSSVTSAAKSTWNAISSLF